MPDAMLKLSDGKVVIIFLLVFEEEGSLDFVGPCQQNKCKLPKKNHEEDERLAFLTTHSIR